MIEWYLQDSSIECFLQEHETEVSERRFTLQRGSSFFLSNNIRLSQIRGFGNELFYHRNLSVEVVEGLLNEENTGL